MPQKNKVKYNIKNVHYARQKTAGDENLSYCKPVKITGAVAVSLLPFGEPPVISSNGCGGYVMSNNLGYRGTLELALLSTDFCIDVLMEEMDENKVMLENSDTELKPFALLFEFEGNSENVRHVLYNCYATRTSLALATNKGTLDVQTESVDIYALPLENGLVKARATPVCEQVYDNWYENVYVPNNSLEE